MSQLSLEGFYKDVENIARAVARRVPGHVSVDDLISAGYLGLVDAARRFDTQRSETFRSYALCRIRGAITDELRRHDVLPRQARIDLKRLQKVRDDIISRTSGIPDRVELARHLGLSVEKIKQLMLLDSVVTSSLDSASLGHGLDASASGLLPADAGLEEAEMRAVVRASLRQLRPRDSQVLDAIFFRGMKLKQVADQFKISEARISQIVSAALKQLRKSGALQELLSV